MESEHVEGIRYGLRALTDRPPATGPLADLVAARARRVRTRRRLAAAGSAIAVAGLLATVALWGPGAAKDASLTPAGPPTPTSTAKPPSPTSNLPTAPATGPDQPMVGVAYPYDLLVHCGVGYARFGQRWWQAEMPTSRAPESATGYVSGTMTLVSSDVAHFTSSNPPLSVDFRPIAALPSLCD